MASTAFVFSTLIICVYAFSTDKNNGNNYIAETLATLSKAAIDPNVPWDDPRIPEYVEPQHYDVHLHPNFNDGVFFGNVSVTFKLNEVTSWIPIHSKKLVINMDSGYLISSTQQVDVSFLDYPTNEFLVLQPEGSSSFMPDVYTLYLEFHGSLTDAIVGFYLSTYLNEQNEIRLCHTWLLSLIRDGVGKSLVMGYPCTKTAVFVVSGVAVVLFIIGACLTLALIIVHQYRPTFKPDNSKNLNNITMDVDKPWIQNHRIPESIRPEHYTLHLHPLLEAGTFSGTVTVTISINDNTTYIPIHVKNLNITRTRLFRITPSGVREDIKYSNAFHSPKNMFWVVLLREKAPLVASEKVNLVLDFNGLLTGKIVGFYRSSYRDGNRKSLRKIATSKFEPTDARAAFPCFDEPALKATFSISLVRPTGDNYIALSNSIMERTEVNDNTSETTVFFTKTIPMSTYLVCFIVCDFTYLREVLVTDNGDKQLPIRVYATKGQVQNTEFALSSALQVTKFYINYFSIPYPLPKLDLIAIPDFISGAMEHWGLITFRETALLFDSNTNSAAEQKRVAEVVAHEIAHQWFGNLVTMQWWDDLWLNEGFASFMELKAVDASITEAANWNLGEQTLVDTVQPVLLKDAALNSHPIVQTVEHPDQINQMFDSISYDKGSTLLRMLENFMGEINFQKGLQNYLNKYEISNAATNDLWACLDQVTASDGIVKVSNVMATWTLQMGFPVLFVARESNKIVLKQTRFLADNSLTFNASESPFEYKWDIPIQYFTSKQKSPELVWFLRNQTELSFSIDSDVKFVKINSKQFGYYRVNYAEEDWATFASILSAANTDLSAILPTADRAHLLDDVFNLASAGYIDYKLSFNLLNYITNETEYLPWATASTSLKSLKLKLNDRPIYSKFRQYVNGLVNSLYGDGDGKFSWNDNPMDSHLRKLMKVQILSLSCQFDVGTCMTDVGNIFSSWLNNQQTTLSPDLRSLIYFYGMQEIGDEKEWDQLWNIYKLSTNAQEKINLLKALANVREPGLLTRFIDYAKDENNVRSQDYFSVLGYIAQNPYGIDLVWQFYRDEWDYLVNRFTLGHRTFGSFILTLTESFCTQARLDELNAFIAKHPDAGAGEASRRNAVENVQTRIKWLERKEKEIVDWLSTNVQ